MRRRCNLSTGLHAGDYSVRAWESHLGQRNANWEEATTAVTFAWGPALGFLAVSFVLSRWIRWLLKPPTEG